VYGESDEVTDASRLPMLDDVTDRLESASTWAPAIPDDDICDDERSVVRSRTRPKMRCAWLCRPELISVVHVSSE
jgi:hypothetical protein